MIQVDDMDAREVADLLQQVGYGHLGCADSNIPYVIPVNYVVDNDVIYIYTTRGKKVEIIEKNPNICLQVEIVKDKTDWQSVIVQGIAKQVTEPKEREHAIELIRETNPSLSPALSIRWVDNWIRENREVVLRLEPTRETGRRSVIVERAAAGAQPVPRTGNAF
jgi:nitroimidazol reductase NimA-like FMN-containing flavoprotein (pyridoxamine 5'-phosphate oxidase superfamily)